MSRCIQSTGLETVPLSQYAIWGRLAERIGLIDSDLFLDSACCTHCPQNNGKCWNLPISTRCLCFFSFFFFSPNKHLLLIPLIRLAVGLLSPLYLWEQGGDAQGSDTTCIDWCAHPGAGIPYSRWLCTALLQSHWFDSISPHKFLLSIHQYRTVHCDSQISRNSLPPYWERCEALSFAGISECRSW